MQAYEIRILKPDHTTAFVIAEMAISDSAALQSAQRIAKDKAFELWRDLECLSAPSRNTEAGTA
jgi:hypothetical protein